MQEEWKPVVGYEHLYEISNIGRLKKISNNTIKSQYTDRNGYKKGTMCKENKHKCYLIHRIVAEAFISNPYKKPYINHIDNNPANNFVSNLEWCTPKENTTHAVKQNRLVHVKGERHGFAKLKEHQVIEIRKSNLRHPELSKIYGVTRSTISQIVRRETWTHI